MPGGRPPKPTKLKILEGNPGKRPLNVSEPQFDADSGYCPRWLSDEARREWRRVVPALAACGLLTVVDRAAVEAYCVVYARWRKAEKALVDHGSLTFETATGYVQQRPEVGIANKAMEVMKAFMIQFGMTPSSRTRVSVPAREEKSDYAEYMAKRDIVKAMIDG